MKLHLFAAAAAALLCAATIVSADADVLEVNNFDFEEQVDNFISESEDSWFGKSHKDRGFFGKSDKDREVFGKGDKESGFCSECRAEARQARRGGRRAGKARVSRAFRSRAVQDECRQVCGIDLRRAIRRAERSARRERDRRINDDDGTKSGKSDFEDFSEDTELVSESEAEKEARTDLRRAIRREARHAARREHERRNNNGYDIDSESPSTPEEYQVDDSPASPTALTCNETEALLKVRYNFSENEWNSFRPDDGLNYNQFLFRRFLRVLGNSMYYENFEDVMDFEGCLPKNDCSEIIVAGLPTSAYDISFDGKSVDIGTEFRYDGFNPVTSTTVGACEEKEPPTCKDTEALVRVQYWSGDFPYLTQQFRVEDSNGGVILTGPGSMPSFTLEETYACVPKDNVCYTFLIGGPEVWDVNYSPPTSYSIAFDGQLVSTNDAWPFDSVRFGGSCKPLCNQDSESHVELFIFTNNLRQNELEFEHEWSLRSFTNHNTSSFRVIDFTSVGPDISPLVHKNICTPKSSCSSFFISTPALSYEGVNRNNETFNATFIPSPTYSLAMDNITYRKSHSLSSRNRNQTTNMGSCTVDSLCDEQSQDLFDLELHTPAKFESPWSGNEMPYVSSISWIFGYTFAEEWQLRDLLRSFDYNGYNMAYELDSRYRTIECVPKGGCDMSFNLTSSQRFNTTSQTFSAVETHTVKKNGVLLDSIFVEGLGWSGNVLMTPFDTNCFQSNNTLSGGAIAGIVVACVAAVAAIVVGLIWYKKRQNQQEKGEDPLHESLL